METVIQNSGNGSNKRPRIEVIDLLTSDDDDLSEIVVVSPPGCVPLIVSFDFRMRNTAVVCMNATTRNVVLWKRFPIVAKGYAWPSETAPVIVQHVVELVTELNNLATMNPQTVKTFLACPRLIRKQRSKGLY